MNDDNVDSKRKGKSPFPSTHWSLLARTRESSISLRRESLNSLIELYWKPVYYYIKWRGNDDAKSQDLSQEFFTAWIERDLFGQADPKRGRFRSFLLSSLNNFLKNAHRKAHAQRRYPAEGFVSIFDLASRANLKNALQNVMTPEEAFHKEWRTNLLTRVTQRLHEECCATNKEIHYQIFHRRIISPILEGASVPSQSDLSMEYGLTEKQVANRLLTARRAYQRLLRDEVQSYAITEEDSTYEIKDLFEFIGNR